MQLSDTSQVIEAMRNPALYDHPVDRVDVIQTHISWVVLAGERVYKIKKAVDFGFLDFSTLKKRRHYCHREVELNSRLCPDLYLGVVPIREDGETVRFGPGSGRIVEYAVEMRRLPQKGMLDYRLANDTIDPATIDQIADILAEFHQQSDSGPRIDSFGSERVIRRNWDENFEQTEPFIGQTISRHQFDYLQAWVEASLRRHRKLLRARVRNRRIRDGHGDLRASAICIDDQICIFDCIEFNKRFRYGDVASDVAFLAMDLSAKGRQDLSDRFVSAYVNVSRDTSLREIIDFYICYRAFVRGKVESFQAVDQRVPPDERTEAAATASSRFAQAVASARKVQPPMLILTCGLSGTGKSAIANALAEALGVTVVASDVVRKELAGIDPGHREPVAYGTGIYTPEFTNRTYREMLRRSRSMLAGGSSVVLDATFSSQEWRDRALAIAMDGGALMLCLECVAGESEIRERLEQRDRGEPTHSDAGWETYLAQRKRFEPVTRMTGWRHIVLDTNGALDATIEAALHAIQDRVDPAGAVPGGQSRRGL